MCLWGCAASAAAAAPAASTLVLLHRFAQSDITRNLGRAVSSCLQVIGHPKNGPTCIDCSRNPVKYKLHTFDTAAHLSVTFVSDLAPMQSARPGAVGQCTLWLL
jgi:hypothetical protein